MNLGPDKDEAFRQYHQLMGKPQEQHVSPESLIVIIDAFLEWTQKNRAPDTYEWYRHRLQRFVVKYPEMRVSALRPYHVEQWVDGYDVAQTTRRNYFRSIKRCLTWARRQGRIDTDSLEALDVPGAERKDVYVPPPDEFERLLKFVPHDRFRELLITTYQTGCRPQESLRVIADWVDVKHGRWGADDSGRQPKDLLGGRKRTRSPTSPPRSPAEWIDTNTGKPDAPSVCDARNPDRKLC